MHTSELLYCTPCLQRHGTQVLATRLHIGEPQCEKCFDPDWSLKRVHKRRAPYKFPHPRPVPDDLMRKFRAETNSQVRLTQKVVSASYGIGTDNMMSTSHDRLLAVARHVAMYIVRERVGLSLPRIGSLFGRHHTSVMNSIRVVKDQIEKDEVFRSEVEVLTKLCESGNKYWAALGA